MVFGKEAIMIVILGNGSVRKRMVMECILGLIKIGMKDNGECASNMDKDMTHFAMEIHISVSMLMENLMEKENIFGQLDKFIQGIFIKELSKVEESGGAIKINQQLQISTKVSIITTKNTVKVFSLRQQVIYTKVIIMKMNVMEMDKCYGPTGVCMKVNGKKEFNMVLVE